MHKQVRLEQPPLNLLQPVKELRDYYAFLVEEYQRLLEEAQAQFNRADALLAAWSNSTPSVPQSSVVFSNASVVNGNGNGHLSTNNYRQVESNDFSKTSSTVTLTPSVTVEEQMDIAGLLTTPLAFSPAVQSPIVEMLPAYQGLSLKEAIEQLLEDYTGTILHLDFIVRSLYGELPSSQLAAKSQLVHRTLLEGVKQSLWDADSENKDCYTWDFNLISTNTIEYLDEEKDVEKNGVFTSYHSNSNQVSQTEPETPGDLTTSVRLDSDIITESELMEMINAKLLTMKQMIQICHNEHFSHYHSIRYPKSFAIFLAKRNVTWEAVKKVLPDK